MTTPQIAPRSMLFMPANQPRMIAKVPGIGADMSVLDLEDAVAPDAKVEARGVLETALGEIADRDPTSLHVRINEPGSTWFDDDLAFVSGLDGVGVVVPKVEGVGVLDTVRAALPGRSIVAGIESGLGVIDVRAILSSGVSGCYFGAEDYIVDLGGRRTWDSTEVLYARSQVVLAARVTGCFAIDQAVVAVKDDAVFTADAFVAQNLGYGGKICLHPRQVELAHEIFSPTEAQVAHARRVLDAGASGVGLVDGVMVDGVHVRQAEAVLRRAGLT